jgi:hypothetical protein
VKSKIIMLILLSLGIILIHVNSYFIPNSVLFRHIILIIFISVAFYYAYESRRRHLEEYARLEKFIRICAWCKTICITDPVTKEEQWIPFEDYMEREYKFKSSHGVCPACYQSQLEIYSSD